MRTLKFSSYISIFLMLISFSVKALLPSSEEVIKKRIEKATYIVEVWKKPINEKTGRRKFAVKDKLVARGVATALGKGYLLTAYHIMEPIVEKRKHHYVKVLSPERELVKGLAISRCKKNTEGTSPDLCLIKGDIPEKNSLNLPKDPFFSPSDKEPYGLINQNPSLAPVSSLLTGNFVKKVKLGKGSDKFQANQNIELFRMNIKTAKANSGSPVFNIKTGRILGLTTNAIELERKKPDGTVESWLETEVIPSQTIRRYLNTPGWKSEKIPDNQLSYSE